MYIDYAHVYFLAAACYRYEDGDPSNHRARTSTTEWVLTLRYCCEPVDFGWSRLLLSLFAFLMSNADYNAKYDRRKSLRDKVETYWLEEPRRECMGPWHGMTTEHPGPAGSLDSSLKRHTTLLNRLKSSLLVGPADALIKEIDGLTLTKYLEEIAAAIVEGASKGKGDAEVAVDVSSLWSLALTIGHCAPAYTPDPEFSPSGTSPADCRAGAGAGVEGWREG